MIEKIHIFHTNDLHSHFEYWFRMQTYVKEQRRLLAANGEASFLVDIGDHMDRANIFTEATLGKGNVTLLNEAEYDVVTIGNNEGITLSFEELYTLYDQANFDVVIGNLRSLHGENPAWLKPYTILTTATGIKIGIIAATAPFEAFYHALHWQVTDPREALITQAILLRDQVDILVCLSHLGISEDELLAEECPLIDVIFGAHTHHFFPQGKKIGDVLLTGGGKFGQYTGHLKISYDRNQKKVVQMTDDMIDNAQLVEIEGEADFLYDLSQQGSKMLSQPVVTLSKTYTKEWFHYSPFADLLAEALYDFTQADCVMFNAGILMGDLKKGHVSALTMHNLLPHPINICTVKLTGAELKEVYRAAQNDEWPELQLKGLGFRGVVFGKLLFYHVTMTKQQELMLNGKVVDPCKTYTLATLDLFTFGYFFPSVKYAKKQYLLPMFIRDILLEYLKQHS